MTFPVKMLEENYGTPMQDNIIQPYDICNYDITLLGKKDNSQELDK